MLHFKNLKRFIFLQRKTREKHFQTAKILEFPSESLILGFTTRKEVRKSTGSIQFLYPK